MIYYIGSILKITKPWIEWLMSFLQYQFNGFVFTCKNSQGNLGQFIDEWDWKWFHKGWDPLFSIQVLRCFGEIHPWNYNQSFLFKFIYLWN